MIITETTDKFLPCRCGHTMTEYTIGYGRTPYGFICKCGKQMNDAKCEITGGVQNLFDYWNSKLRNQTKNEMITDRDKVMRKIDRMDEKPMVYQHYWFEGKGEELFQRW